MKSLRRLLRDRISLGAIVAFIAYVLLLQAFLVGSSQGAMAMSAISSLGDPTQIICSSTDSGHAGDEGHQGRKAIECPCATLCRLASSAMPAILDAPSVSIAVRLVSIHVDMPIRPDGFIRQVQRGLIAEPRAPPLSV